MTAAPYRIPADRPSAELPPSGRHRVELLPFFATLWLATLARVVAALMHNETFGVDPTLALLVFLALPCLVKDEVENIATG